MKNIPYNYCATCAEPPKRNSDWCTLHTNQRSIYCSNCGAVLNPLIDHPKPHERQLCSGCGFAFTYPPTVLPNSPAQHYMQQALNNIKLPVHVRQAYERHLSI